MHYHVAFTETFTVMEGALDFYLGRERRRVTLPPGQSVTAEIGQPHTFATTGMRGPPLRLRWRRVRRAAWWRRFRWRTRWQTRAVRRRMGCRETRSRGWSSSGRVRGFLPGVPLLLQRGLFALAAWVAKVRGIGLTART
jgi:hypothetical protein